MFFSYFIRVIVRSGINTRNALIGLIDMLKLIISGKNPAITIRKSKIFQ